MYRLLGRLRRLLLLKLLLLKLLLLKQQGLPALVHERPLLFSHGGQLRIPEHGRVHPHGIGRSESLRRQQTVEHRGRLLSGHRPGALSRRLSNRCRCLTARRRRLTSNLPRSLPRSLRLLCLLLPRRCAGGPGRHGWR